MPVTCLKCKVHSSGKEMLFCTEQVQMLSYEIVLSVILVLRYKRQPCPFVSAF